ncbi:IS66 family insertion sequence element accessory protein TnpA [Pseudoalteromonas nigrifaciens]|uniref:IS66 family insertion sequence element accessory protein TnpA n=2 Tax=Pseudoalteromonas TaxID=53246 RepID=UPI0025B52A1B|nr:DUF4879 domain-containing protein [Pseudoalteromonas sp. APC 3694]MDN3491031.1 DUF4879 domain-containing protein [Pseudoalteromonas sp. APC 3694]
MNKQQKIKHWQGIFEQQKSSGLAIIQFCRDNNINASTFYVWRKRLSDETVRVKKQQVIPFVIHEQAFTQPSIIKLTTPNGYQIDFESTLANQTLATSVSTRAAAQGITYFEIGAVQSVSYPNIDPVSANQFSTTQNHGGGQVRVYVFQFGYGNTNNATFAGSSVSATSSTPRCGANLSTCSAGQTVTGFLHQFDFFGASNISGTVNVSANSIASPFGFWSDSVFVQ